jgi:hypothetical protein
LKTVLLKLNVLGLWMGCACISGKQFSFWLPACYFWSICGSPLWMIPGFSFSGFTKHSVTSSDSFSYFWGVGRLFFSLRNTNAI